MKTPNYFKLLLIAMLAISIYSCSDEPYDLTDVSQDELVNDEFAVLGKKREIAFTVENMQKAYESILQNPTASQHPKDGQYNANRASRAIGNYQITTTIIMLNSILKIVLSMKQ